jgi:hypothetical protein
MGWICTGKTERPVERGAREQHDKEWTMKNYYGSPSKAIPHPRKRYPNPATHQLKRATALLSGASLAFREAALATGGPHADALLRLSTACQSAIPAIRQVRYSLELGGVL